MSERENDNVVSKIYELLDGDEIPLSSFCDEFGVDAYALDLRKLHMVFEIETGWYAGDPIGTWVKISYDLEGE